MYKPLPRIYTRDPFDLEELVRWTLEVGFNFHIDRTGSQMIEFSRRAVANGYLHTQRTKESITLQGIAYISDQPAEVDSSRLKQMIQGRSSHGRSMLIVAARRFSDEARRLAAKRRTLCVSREDIDQSLMGSYPFAPPTFAKEQIGGILAPIKSAYIDRLITEPNQEKTYFKGGPVGKFLKAGHTVFFYVESNTASGAIMAKAAIRDAKAGPPDTIWDESFTRTPVFEDRNQYEAWSSDKTDVVAITYTNLEHIEAIQRQDLHSLNSFATLEEDQVGTFYLSAQDVEVLLSRCRSAQSPPLKAASINPTSGPISDLRLKLTNGEKPDFSYPAPVQPKMSPVSSDKTLSLLAETHILLVTAATIELETTLSFLKPRVDGGSIYSGYKGQAVYYFGQLGNYRVTVAKCKAGSNRRDGATLTVKQAIEDCTPWALIAVGIAFGGYTSELRIGDVLVSEQIIPYEIRRVGSGGAQYRGPIPEAGPVLLNRFSNPTGWEFKRPDGRICKVKSGPLLSGETLLDDIDEKVRLFSEQPTSIGGEMEAAGIYAAATRHDTKCEWIIVKAVCDWADGTKKAKGDAYQPLAAASSLSLVEFVLSLPDALIDLRPQTQRSGPA